MKVIESGRKLFSEAYQGVTGPLTERAGCLRIVSNAKRQFSSLPIHGPDILNPSPERRAFTIKYGPLILTFSDPQTAARSDIFTTPIREGVVYPDSLFGNEALPLFRSQFRQVMEHAIEHDVLRPTKFRELSTPSLCFQIREGKSSTGYVISDSEVYRVQAVAPYYSEPYVYVYKTPYSVTFAVMENVRRALNFGTQIVKPDPRYI